MFEVLNISPTDISLTDILQIGHFAQLFAHKGYFDRDFTYVSQLISLHRKMCIVMQIIRCFNIHNRIKIHFFMLAVSFQFLSMAGTWFDFRSRGLLY